MDEIQLIELCKNGNMAAFEQLYNKYCIKAIRTAFLITGRHDLSEEIVQESFIQCYREISKLRDPRTFSSWFYRILTRISWRYSSKERSFSAENIEDVSGSLLSEQDQASRHIENEETRSLINDALYRLNKPIRTTVILYYFNGMSVKEISKTMGCFEGTVKSRLHNARKQLSKELRELYTHDTYLNTIQEERKCKPNAASGAI